MVTPLSTSAATASRTSGLAIDLATASVAALWLSVAFGVVALDVVPDGEAIAFLMLASLAIPALLAAAASLIAPAQDREPAGDLVATSPTPRLRRPPRIVLAAPCCHCGRLPVRPRREPRILRNSRPALQLVRPEPRYRRTPRIIVRN